MMFDNEMEMVCWSIFAAGARATGEPYASAAADADRMVAELRKRVPAKAPEVVEMEVQE